MNRDFLSRYCQVPAMFQYKPEYLGIGKRIRQWASQST